MSTYKQPVGQKRLTNIAVVRMKKHGQRFEVACYKNKVMSWRSGVEKDIDEVLQTHTIFSNVGKGTLAKSADLIKAFGTDDEEVVCRQILASGEYQVSDKEREMVVGSLLKDITFLVMEKTINPDTQRPYSLAMIEKFVHDVHFSVDPNRSSKQQALELIRVLSSRFPISRARMELKLTVPHGEPEQRAVKQLSDWGAAVRGRAVDNATRSVSMTFHVDPGKYRECDAAAAALGGRLEVLATAVQKEGDLSFDELDEHRPNPSAAAGVDSLATGLAAACSVGSGQELLGPTATPTGDGSEVRPSGGGLAAQPHGADGGTGLAQNGGRGGGSGAQAGGMRCTTCQADLASRGEYREHCKSGWHKHNMRRKARQLTPLSAEDCEADDSFAENQSDLDEYAR